MLPQPVKWIELPGFIPARKSAQGHLHFTWKKREMQKRVIHKTVSHYNFESELYLFYISQRGIQKFYMELPFSKEDVVWFGYILNTCQVPFSISVFPSTIMGNIV